MVMSLRRGRPAGAWLSNRPSPTYASASPLAPPTSASMRLSTSRARTIRREPAPSAARMASSCCRPSARTSIRVATFAHAISITMPNVPMTTHNALPALPTTSCLSGRSAGVMRQFS
jgi:hypothetical protein